MTTNERIISLFQQLRDLRLSQGETHRANAYEKAIAAIHNYPKQIESGAEAMTIPGIGKGLGEKIDEILRTGTVAELAGTITPESIERDRILKLFGLVERVGPETAKKWYAAGYRGLEDVPREVATEGQWVGLKLHHEFSQRIPRDEIAEAEAILHRCLDPLGIRFEIAGSYRRGRPDSGDIDILVIDRPDIDVMNTVLQCPIFVYRFAQGPKKFLGVGKIRQLHRRIDVELVQPHEYPYAITYFTGSQGFNIKMRDHAAKYGLRLNEKGLFGPMGEFYPAASEEDLFRILGLQYLTPQERDKY